VNRYSSKEYWTQLARDFARSDEKGFAPVLHPGAPDWFNEAIDRLQAKAWNRALDCCALGKNAQVLDVGCGTGRWVRRLGQRELSVVGIDQSLLMLRLAQERGTLSPLFAGQVQNLPFHDESFDCVSGITVVQHILPSQQGHALREMIRVLRPGGYLILFELIRGQGPHVFSRKPADWISQVSAMGPRLILWFGQEFLLSDRPIVALLQRLRTLAGYAASETLPGKSQDAGNHTGLGLLARRIYWAIRKISVVTAVWIEPLAEKICPEALATHGVFLFQKEKAVG
jgi:SAM-dependent methyltransferase